MFIREADKFKREKIRIKEEACMFPHTTTRYS